MAPELTMPPDAVPYKLPAESRSNGPLTVDASSGGGPNACRTVSRPLLNSNTVPQPSLEQLSLSDQVKPANEDRLKTGQ